MNARPTIKELRALEALAHHRSFRKSASALNLAPSSLSHIIRDLEAKLGFRLLNRSTRSVALTEAGEQTLKIAVPALNEFDRALEQVISLGGTPSGILRITASPYVVNLLLEEVAPQFLAQCPRVSLDLIAQSEHVDIVEQRIDAGIRLGDDVPLDMIAVRFGPPSRMAVVGAPSYFESAGSAPSVPQNLTKHRCITSRTGSDYTGTWEFSGGAKPLKVSVPSVLTLDSTTAMIQAAVCGTGLAYVPRLQAEDALRSGQLVAVLEEWCPVYPGLFLFYPGHRLVRPALRIFIDILKTSHWARRVKGL